MEFLELNDVSKIYEAGGKFSSKKIKAVSGVSFSMKKGECLGIVGQSGSGKSTLGRMIMGLEPPSNGHVMFQGEPAYKKKMKPDRRRKLQMVYQNSYEATNPKFSAYQVVEEPLRYFGLREKKDIKPRVHELLENVGIPSSEAGKKVMGFSGGQLQRICIARALAAEPELLVLDEPTSSLDVSVQAQILNLLKDLKEAFDLSYLLVSHNLEVIYYLADRLIIMYKGVVVEELDDITKMSEVIHPYSVRLLNAARYMDMGKRIKNNVNTEHGCIYADNCPHFNPHCLKEPPTLKEVQSGHRVACFCNI